MSYASRFPSLVHILEQSVQKFPSKHLFGTRGAGGWTWVTYREFGELVSAFRAGLAALGVRAGDRVAVISNNRLEWAVAAHATYSLGAVYVAMYETQLDKEWAYILKDSGAKVCLVANRSIHDRVAKFRGDCPELGQLVVFEGAPDGARGYSDLLAEGKKSPVAAVSPLESDVATFIYTSGTTGNPKGVKLTHRNLAANVSGLLDAAPIREDDRSLAFLPWAHVFGGCVELNSMLATGNSIAICSDTTKIVEFLPEVQPTVLFAVPRIWNRIYDGVQKQIAGKPPAIQALFRAGMAARSKLKRGASPSLGERIALPIAEKLIFSKIVAKFGGKLRFAFSGAAALSREVAEFIDNLGIEVYEGYGMTESSGGTTANRPGECKLGSVGKPIPGVTVRLDFDAPGAHEGEGEVIIYGTGVMAGYHNLEDATRESLTADGGLRSGDLGKIDADGFLFITGRVKELYKLSNGKYVAPAPLEEKLQLSPYIAQCVVYGEDQPHNVALIVPDLDSLKAWAATEGVSGGFEEV
ncbi:MAG: long-chain fatty acid--CoA ligase, partial [Deltaproteobacteria bacterium]|nr:long-chain fatty acid--CoA ligase [Deltaproteobacteria bacterium]